jgi:NADH-quinone oxidoreductase subunit E
MLHLVQSVEGRVTPAGIEACATILGSARPTSAAWRPSTRCTSGVPVGKYHVGVCTTALCAILGGDEVFARLQEHLGIGNEETTEDGQITLEHLECNAACDFAPVMMVNWEFFDNMTPESACAVVDQLRAGEPVQASRGAQIGTWREAERVLAGFPDGKADQGVTAAGPSLLGLNIARERGWSAPEVRPEPDDEDEEQKEARDG